MSVENGNGNNHSNTNTPPSARRSSLAGDTFSNLFGGRRGSVSRTSGESYTGGNNAQQQPTPSYPGPISSAAAQAQRRRSSLTTLGLSGSPSQISPFGTHSTRYDSYASGTSDSIDESAIEDDYVANQPPQTPFGRRLSFGAKALKDVRTGGGTTPPGQNGGHASASPFSTKHTAIGRKAQHGTISSRDANGRVSSEGFNWSDSFRNRAERTSIASGGGVVSGFMGHSSASSQRTNRGRAQSVAVMEPPIREIPKPKEQGRPDHFQERILKGDFYMD